MPKTMKLRRIQIILCSVISSFLIQLVKCEFYTAIVEMEKLLNSEGEIVKSLEQYLKVEEERLEKLKWFSEHYSKLHSIAEKDVETFLSNPVNAYLLLKSLTIDWETANHLIKSSDSKAIIDSIKNQILLPSNDDLSGAAAALMRLQDIYLLDTATIASGQIKGTNKTTELTAGDCFELGTQAYAVNDWKHTLLWMQEALSRFNKETDVKTAKKVNILEYMALANYGMGNFSEAFELSIQVLSIDPTHPRVLENIGLYQAHAAKAEADKNRGINHEKVNETLSEDNWPDYLLHPSIIRGYQKLCRGESLKTPKEESKLRCYYITNNNAYLLLQPLKVEVLNLKPRIAMYYDVLSDKQADVIKSIAIPRLQRATVNSENPNEHVYASYRISQSTWLTNNDHSEIPRINRRIETITGLSSELSEALHVINYGIGGHYEAHFDFTSAKEKVSFTDEMGNRIATWIFYLSDVAAGGSTVFPSIGVAVKPVKGAAAFWFNLHRNGLGDENTRHAACPVLAGSKWVANKWLHEFGNEFNRPCSLDPLE